MTHVAEMTYARIVKLESLVPASGLICLAYLAACGTSSPDEPPLSVTPVVRFALAQTFGFEGSPTLCDLDHDGRLELVAPVASDLFPGELRVLDAQNGALRFRNAEAHAAYSYPFCTDVNADGTDDVLIAGRGSDVWAISGTDGATLYRLGQSNPGAFPAFVNELGSVVGDSTGALFVALRGSYENGVPGAVVAFDRTGIVRARWDEPAGAEIYSSPAIARLDADTFRVVIGSGGEQRPGAVHVLEYDETNELFTLMASVPSGCDGGGFVASPALADLDGDGTLEIAAADFCGHGIAFTALGRTLFDVHVPERYATANPTFVRHGDRVDVLFAFAAFSPSVASTIDIAESVLVRVSSATAREVFRTTLPTLALATPSTLELTGDDVTDVLVVGTDLRLVNEGGLAPLTAGLFLVDGATGALRAHHPYGNAASSPIIGDVDADGAPDVFVFDSLHDQPEPHALMRIELVGATYDAARTATGFRGFPRHDGAL